MKLIKINSVLTFIIFRCDKWIKYSDNPWFKGLEDKKLRNRNVCEEHFRVQMFMNIRKERLVRFAYPTLLRTKRNGKVYDLEKMVKNNFEIDTLRVDSVIDDYCDKFLVDEEENPLNIIVPPKEPAPIFTLNEKNISDIPVEFEPEKSPEKVKILSNKLVLTPVRTKVVKRSIAPEKNVAILTPVPVKKPKTMKILNSNLIKTTPTEPIQIHSTISSDLEIVSKSDDRIEKLKQENLEKIKKITQERDKAIIGERKALKDLQESKLTINELNKKLEELERKLKAAETQKKGIKKELQTKGVQTTPEPVEAKQTVKTSTMPVPAQASAKTLGKPQLFNGIKRYLSNAMATLLKMEMFGNSEREWKTDEKKISCEIMRLGKETYEFFTDEWRLRLPSKSEVNKWMQENADDDDDDLL